MTGLNRNQAVFGNGLADSGLNRNTENGRKSGIGKLTRKLRRGFTLMELLIVVAIIGILGALAAVGVIQFNKSLKVMELNNTAEEIYIAAQNHLTAAQANAVSVAGLEQSSAAKVSTISKNPPKDCDSSTDWKSILAFDNSGKNETAAGADQSTYDTPGSIILPSGAVDGTVSGEGSSWIIEYNPEAFTVYGVFYTDGKSAVLGKDTDTGITVSDLGALNPLVLNAGNSTKITDYGDKNICVGYYGGSNAGKIDTKKLTGKLSVSVVNNERLYAVIKSDVKAEDDSTAAIRLIVKVEGMASGASRTLGVYVDSDGKIVKNKTADDPLWSQSGTDIRLLLDDITQDHTHFADIFRDGQADNGRKFIPGENIIVSAYAQAAGYLSDIIRSSNSEKTNSLFGKLTKTEKNGVTVEQVSVGNYRHLENLSSKVSHVMRMTGSGKDAENAVSLTAGNDKKYDPSRYAFRAIMTSDLTDARTDDEKQQKDQTASISQKNKSWSGFFNNCGKPQIDKTGTNEQDVITFAAADQTESGKEESTSNGSFSPVNNIYLSEFDGNNKTIEGLYISRDDSHAEARGLFGTIDQKCDCTIKDLTLRNFDISSSRNPFSDAVQADSKFICAGSLAGRAVSGGNKIVIENVAVWEKDDSYCGVWCSSQSKGTNAAPVRNGGLIGEIQTADASNPEISISGSSASVYVQSSAGALPERGNKQPGLNEVDIAGGLIGHVEGNSGKISIENSYAGGHTDNASVSPYYSSSDKIRGESGAGRNVSSDGIAGGLTGAVYTSKKANINIDSDYSTASAACALKNTVADYSDAGGLIGYVSNNVGRINVSDCYSTGLVEGTWRGGVIGYIALDSTDEGSITSSFKKCSFLEKVSLEKDGSDIPAVNVLEQHADTDTAHNQKIAPYDQLGDSVYPVNYTALTTNGGTAQAEPYDQVLKNTAAYPFVSAQKIHYGDWPVVKTEQSFEGDFGVLYYEIVQHGSDKSARDYYYHGFVGDLTADGSKLNYEEVNTLNTNAQACAGRPYSNHALLTGHDEYVVEEGYLILTSEHYQQTIDKFNEENKNKQNEENSESITVEIGGGNDGNNSNLTVASKVSNHKMEEYDNFLTKANIVGYKAYAINSAKYAGEARKSVSLLIRDQRFKGGNNSSVAGYSQFYFQPVFSDTLSEENPGNFNTYSIRSAKQLKMMFESGGNTTTDVIQNGEADLRQTMDISYDSNKVKFTELAFSGQKDHVVNSGKTAYESPYFSGNFNAKYYSSTPAEQTTSQTKPDAKSGAVHYILDGLNRHFINVLSSTGRLNNIYVTNVDTNRQVSDLIDTIVSGGQLNRSNFDYCSFTSGVVGTNSGLISGNVLNHCGGNSFVNLNRDGSAIIKNTTIYNSTFSGAVVQLNKNNALIDTAHAYSLTAPDFVNENTENNSKIQNVQVENAHFNVPAGAFVNLNDSQASMINCSVEYADFEGYGFVNNNKGTIRDCHISDAVIELNGNHYGGGFVNSNTGTITNCQIYSNGLDNYKNSYLKKYDSSSALFHPLHFTVNAEEGVSANNPESAYDLVTVGINGNFANKRSDFSIDAGVREEGQDGSWKVTEGIGGFAYLNSSNGSITNCSFTGSVFGSIATGFIYSNRNQITCSYANAYDYGISYSCGFMYANSANNADKNHALGQILGRGSGSGFLKENSGTVSNSYTAVWNENVNTYYPFYDTGNRNLSNDYAMKDLTSGAVTDQDNITLVTDDEFRNYNSNQSMKNLGGEPSNGTSAYLTSLSGAEYPYPMPSYYENVNGNNVNKTLKAYGDWKTNSGLLLNPSEIDIYQGDTYDLSNIRVYFNNQTVPGKQLQWTLTNPDTGSNVVDLKDGVLSGLEKGSDTITVSYSDVQDNENSITYSAQLTVKVIPKTVSIQKTDNGESTDITGTEQTEYVGASMTLSAVLSPEDPKAEIAWVSSDPDKASVSVTSGVVTINCRQAGEVTVTAGVNNQEGYSAASFTLHILNKSLQIYYNGSPVAEDGITLSTGESRALQAYTLPDNVQNHYVTWISSDNSIVTINSSTGEITAGQNAGTVTITASGEGLDAGTCTVKVVQQNLIAGKINAAGLKIHNVSEYTLQNGSILEAGTIIEDADGNYCLVTGTNSWYNIYGLTTVTDIVNSSPQNMELINDSTSVIDVGQDRKIPIPSDAGIILHYVNCENDEYYILKQAVNDDTTIDNVYKIKIGMQ